MKGYAVNIKDKAGRNVTVFVGDLRDINNLATIIYGNNNDEMVMTINTFNDDEEDPYS
ncbi:MAG: hypothetical protein IJT37_10035 [Lachnospiraceae bacterium]|nr:hypothetical protein [Lachnospiraceae bacterium]